MRSLEQLDRWIAVRVKSWASKVSSADQSPGLLEIRRDILEDVRDRIEPVGGGRVLLPFNFLRVSIGARSTQDLELYEAVFATGGALEQDIRAFLAEAGCTIPAGFSVEVEAAEDAALASSDHPFRVQYTNRKGGVESKAAGRPAASLMVVQGQADVSEYTIAGDRVNLGRLKEVVGERGGLRRRNDVAFADTETSVSREHACIRFENEAFRLYDSNSERGTIIFRDGRRIDVPRSRGIQLQSGDEVHLGDARVRFALGADE
jgi:hypothetical protein